MEAASIVKDILVGISAIIVAGAAIWGLRTWRKELTGKAKFDIARNIMRLALKLEGDFEWVRHPLSRSWESAERKKKDNETPAETQLLDEWYVRSGRLRPLVENLQKLQELALEAEVLLGEEASSQVSEAMQTLRESYATLSTAIENYFEITHQEVITGEPFNDPKWLSGLRREIYPLEKDDELSKKVNGAKGQLISVLKTYVK